MDIPFTLIPQGDLHTDYVTLDCFPLELDLQLAGATRSRNDRPSRMDCEDEIAFLPCREVEDHGENQGDGAGNAPGDTDCGVREKSLQLGKSIPRCASVVCRH